MIDEIDDVLYQWKQGMLSREAAEDRILNIVLEYECRKREQRAAAKELAQEHV